MASMVSSTNVSSTTVIAKRYRRRRPTVFSKWQLERLEAEFSINRYPDIDVRERLATSLSLGEDRIQVSWDSKVISNTKDAMFKNQKSKDDNLLLNTLAYDIYGIFSKTSKANYIIYLK